jgi:hypothetical protein
VYSHSYFINLILDMKIIPSCEVLPNTVGSGRSSDSPISTTVVSGRVNVVKGLKRKNQVHMLGSGEVDIWLI